MASKSSTDDIAFEYIDTPEQLGRFTDALAAASEAALDTEADSFHHYQPKVCLIQLTVEGRNVIIDPLADIEMTAFLDCLAQKKLILHDAGYDLRLLYNDFGFKPRAEIFDTMLAASLAGLKNVSLSALLNLLFGKNMPKHNQKADWSKRPLKPTLLQYAAEDTVYLGRIKTFLQAELEKHGRTAWYREACQWAIRSVYTPREEPDPDRQWRIKGAGKCSPREMAYLKQLWHWREEIARRTNIAPFMICRNDQMLKLAQWAAHRRKPIGAQTKLPIRCHNRYEKSIIPVLEQARNMPEDQWPGKIKSDRTKRLSDKTQHVINQLKRECEKIAHQYDLAPQLIASRSALTRIVIHKADTLQAIRDNEILMDWQAELLLPAIKKVLAPGQ